MPSYRWPNVETTPKRVPLKQPVPIYKYSKHNFFGCGVDNYTNPPAQDPELFEQLTNIQPITDGTIGRRWGYSLWANPGITPSQLIFDYQSDISLSRKVIATAPTFVSVYNDDGSGFQSSLFTPSANATAPREVTSRSFAYFSDGIKTDFQKWNGNAAGGVSNWGIDATNITSSSTASFGPNFPATVTDLGTGGTSSGSQGPNNCGAGADAGGGSGSNFTWSSPNNIGTGGATSTGAMMPGSVTDWLQGTNFGFTSSSVPNSATIVGIAVSFTKQGGDNVSIFDNQIRIIKGGTRTGTDHSDGQVWKSSGVADTYGGSSDLWGTTWAPSDIQSSGFGIAIQASNEGSTNRTATVVAVTITVYYTIPTTTFSWTNPNNVKADDGAVASATATTGGTSVLQTLNYFSTVTGTIQGIKVEVKCDYSGSVQPTLYAQLQKSSANYGAVKQLVVTSTSLGYIVYGSNADLWSGTWGSADLNSSGFGIAVYATTSTSSCIINIDAIRITVYVVPTGFSIGGTSGTGITVVSGRRYTYCFKNSSTTHYSDIGPFTASTGALSNQGQIVSNIPKCNDSQVDTVELLATADGGDETRLYLVAELVNASGPQNYTDSMPEATLLAQPVLLSTDANGNEFGVTFNDPPSQLVNSAGSGGFVFPTKHRGRIYMVNGSTLAWSKSIEDVTTDTGFIAGKWEESFPAVNSLDVSEGAESVRGLLTDGINLYLGTEFKIRRLNGDAPFLEPPDIVHNGVGLLNQDVWKIVFRQGTPVGAMWLTPDQRVILSDFNTYQDISLPVQTILATLNTSIVNGVSVLSNVARASFYSNGPNDWYVLAVPTGTNTSNDTLLIFDLRAGQWFVWNLTDKLSSMFWHITFNGIPSFILAASTGKLYQLTPFSTQDRLSDTPVNFTSTIRTSWLMLGDDPTMRKVLNEMEVITDDPSNLLVTVEGATSHPDFLAPTTVVSNRSVQTVRTGQQKIFFAGTGATHDKFYRFTFSSNSTVAGLLQGYVVEIAMVNRT